MNPIRALMRPVLEVCGVMTRMEGRLNISLGDGTTLYLRSPDHMCLTYAKAYVQQFGYDVAGLSEMRQLKLVAGLVHTYSEVVFFERGVVYVLVIEADPRQNTRVVYETARPLRYMNTEEDLAFRFLALKKVSIAAAADPLRATKVA